MVQKKVASMLKLKKEFWEKNQDRKWERLARIEWTYFLVILLAPPYIKCFSCIVFEEYIWGSKEYDFVTPTPLDHASIVSIIITKFQ